jgi:hypothetical protein
MTTVSDVRASGTDIVTVSTPIVEPLNAPPIFSKSLGRFGDNYNLSNGSHLHRFLLSLCGEAGAGSLKKELLVPRLQQQLEGTHFTDLDKIYGGSLGLPRNPLEIYMFDPVNEILTIEAWQEIYTKDANYRERCLTWMRALIEGPTPRGLALAAEAAIGVECDVFERYKYVENAASDSPITINNLGVTNSRNEFVIIPAAPNITEAEERQIRRMIDKLRPTNTISSIADGDYYRTGKPVTNIGSTSERFNVLRFVTGNPDVDWPDIDPSLGFWISSTEENQAPTYAFMDHQEAVTYLSIQSVSSSSDHVGPFNPFQSSLFVHLSGEKGATQFFPATDSFAKTLAPIAISTPWIGSTAPSNQIVLNNYYPIGYFAQENVEQFATVQGEHFWASSEKNQGETDYLLFDLGRLRPCNFIDFEISQKPIDFVIEWSTDGMNWTEVEQLQEFPTTTAVTYLPSLDNPWHYFEMRFNLVQLRYLRITFTRRDDRFPLDISDYFPWSIEIRMLRAMHVIPSVDLYVEDQGVDILGNAYRTELQLYDAGNVIDEDEPDDLAPTFWQSQPNPSRMAVEALYFDLRTGLNTVNMTYLDQWNMQELDTWGMHELDTGHYEDGTVIDEIYIDPVTFGPTMHIYYSLDDTPNWDDKLWTPIPRTYTLRRGYHALPSPTFVKYIKLEFTNLKAAPYQAVDYPNIPPIRFRRFPTWVQNYFNNVYPAEPMPTTTQVFDRIQINPLELSFQKQEDSMTSNYQSIRDPRFTDEQRTNQIKTFIDDFLNLNSESSTSQSQVEDKIRLRTPVMWQQDLIGQLDLSRALSRKAQEDETGFTAELGLPVFTPPVVQSVADLSASWTEKKQPTIFFPFRCRHGYQIVEAPFINKLAFYVAIKTVSFFRRDYSIEFDDKVYVESLDDQSHIEFNEFIQADWRYIVS